MSDDLRFHVLGKPRPKGSMEAVGPRGRGGMKESNPETGPWRQAVAWAAMRAKATSEHVTGEPYVPLLGPVEVQVVFSFDKPVSAPKLRRIWPITRSTYDLDKLMRTVFDALVDAQAMRDDSQVVRMVGEKVFCGDSPIAMPIPGAAIVVRSMNLGDDGAQ